ncbi:Helix-loop-helix DNA-binding domain family protein [Acanthocheilonema viteae]|uniref:BHLH domain-containing protein n=1 Tax=Acanthocheilonema viteae TaxID=6277 RepID=A0A498SAE0_ACAVI|nr:unnamed protein product [Acanthocheilonema viteae]
MRNGIEGKISLQNVCMKKRSQSNRKERRRNEEMNLAYARLQRCVPHIPHDQKLAKIKTLRLATLYIKHLEAVIDGSVQVRSSSSQELRPLEVEDFASIAMAEIQARNNYKDLAEKELRRGIRTEDICRQTVPERYSLPKTPPENHFLSLIPPYPKSPTVIHNNSNNNNDNNDNNATSPALIHNNQSQISSFPGQYIIDNLCYLPLSN